MTPEMDRISAESIVERKRGLIASEIDGEIVALNIDTGVCYGLNAVGSRIFQMLNEPTRIADLCAKLVEEYAVEPAACEHDVLELVETLKGENLVVVAGAPS